MIGADDDGFKPTQDNGNGSQVSQNIDNVVLLPTGPGWYSAGKGGYQNEQHTTTLAKAYYWRMPKRERDQVSAAFGLLGEATGSRSPKTFWDKFVDASVNTGQTPFQIMSSFTEQAKAGNLPEPPGGRAPGGGSSGSGSGGGPYQRTDIQFTDKSTAHALVDSALQTYLGRDATAKERKKFYDILTNRQAGNPQVTSGVTSGSSASSVTTGGTNPQEAAKEFAESRKGYSEFQAATTYLDAFIGALGNPTKVI